MISHKHQCIFVHIPRCGGTSIEDVIWPNMEDRTDANLWMGFVSKYRNKYQTGGLQHLLARQIELEVGSVVFKRYFKFAIIRNPWDKAVSQFSYMKSRKDLREFIGMKDHDDFKQYLSLIQKTSHVQWLPQHIFLESAEGDVLVDFVGRFENFQNDFSAILERLQLRGVNQIPHKNKSCRSHYRDYYDSEAMEMIREMYAIDIRKFGYVF